MSLFVAAVPDDAAIEHLADALHDARRDVRAANVRWTAPERWHITVAFLGDPGEHVDEAVADALERMKERPPIPGLALASAGSFGRQILWIGLGEGPALDTLADIGRGIPALLRGTGAVPDRRPWRPHLTIGRMRGGSPAGIVDALSSYRGPEWAARELMLVRSRGGPHPHHEIVASLPLRYATD